MDTTHDTVPAGAEHPDDLIAALEQIDPADAPEVADRLASLMSRELDHPGEAPD